MEGRIRYNDEPILQKKRVLFEPETATDIAKTGYVVCYNNDRTTNLNGVTIAEGSQNPARFLQVEKPKTANLRFVAGIICPESEGAVYGDSINIYLLNGADIPVWTDQNCTNGTTTLAVTDGSYKVTAVGAVNVALGLAKETINRSVANGLVLMKSYPTAGLVGDTTAISAAISQLSNSLSQLNVSAMNTLSNALSNAIASEASGNLSLATRITSAISDVNTTIDSAISDVNATIDSAISDVVATEASGNTSLATMVDSAISDLKASAHSELLSQVKIVSDATSAVKESCLSDLASAISDVFSAMANVILSEISGNTSLHTMVDSAISDIVAGNTVLSKVVIADGGTVGQTAGPLLTFNDIGNILNITGCAGGIGINEAAPITLLEITHTDPYITLHNSTSEDTNQGRESRIIARDNNLVVKNLFLVI